MPFPGLSSHMYPVVSLFMVSHISHMPISCSLRIFHTLCLFSLEPLLYLWVLIVYLLFDSFFLYGFLLSFLVVIGFFNSISISAWVIFYASYLFTEFVSKSCIVFIVPRNLMFVFSGLFLLFPAALCLYFLDCFVFPSSLTSVFSSTSLRNLFSLCSFSLNSLSCFFVSFLKLFFESFDEIHDCYFKFCVLGFI